MGETRDRFAETVRRRLAELELSARGAAIQAGMPKRSIQALLEGNSATIDRVAEICDALGLEFYAGPARVPLLPWDASDVEGAPLQAAGAVGDDARSPAGVAVAGEGARPGGFAPAGCVSFAAAFLSRWGLDPERCLVLGIEDDAMAPALPEGCSILADMERVRRMADAVYLLFDGEGLLVRRAVQDRRGRWLLACDNPGWEDRPWPEQVRIVAQVVWFARILL